MYLQQEFRDITLRQLELMAHTIGFDRKKIKYNKFEVNRNYFTTSAGGHKDKVELDRLVDLRMMIKRNVSWDGETICQICYHVTKLGFSLFQKLYDCKLIERD